MVTKDFRTKTYRIERQNGQKLPVWLIGLDMGYSSVKTFSPNSVTMFPSYAQEIHNKAEQGTIGNLPDSYIRYTDLNTGAMWLIGEAAQDNISDKDTSVSEAALYGRERYSNEMFRVLVEAGLGASLLRSNAGSKEPDQEIFVETGLPPKYLQMDSELLTDVIAGEHHFTLQFGQKQQMEFHFEVKRENVHVMQQPMGTLFSISYQNEAFGKEAMLYMKKNVMIFDIGFGTADFFPLKNHTIAGSETFPNLGMREILKETSTKIMEQYQAEISVPALQKYLTTGEFKRFDRRRRMSSSIPFGEILEEASRKVCERALDELFRVYPMEEFDYLVLTGGTAMAWEKYIREDLKDMTTLTIVTGGANDTIPHELSNVRGYYWYRYNWFMSRKGKN